MRQRTGPLARREFRIYFAGNLASNIGTWVANVALGVYMLELTGSSFWVGVVNAALFVPVIFFALPAGALADRTDRLRLLRTSQVFAGALAGLLALLVSLDAAPRLVVVLIAAGWGVSIAVAIPAMQAMVPSLVPHGELAEAIGMNALTFNVARAIGPVLAAVTLTTLGTTFAFGLNALSYAAIVAALLAIRRPPFLRESSGPPGPPREGLVYAWRHLRTRTMLLAVMAISVSLDPITTLSPALARSYGLATGGAGWIVSSWGLGAVLGITAGRRLINQMSKRGLGWAGLIGQAAGMAALGAAPNVAAAIPAGILTGFGYITAVITFTTAIQTDVPERLRGRVMALWTISFLGPRVAAAVVDGALADAFGPHVAASCFALPALVAAWFVRRTTPPAGAEPVVAPAPPA
jgi:MFS family permease